MLGTIIGFLLFAICVIGVSYAYYVWQSNETAVDITIEDVKFEFLTGSDVNVTGIGPILDYTNSNYYTEENKNKYLVYTDFTVDNQINKTYYISVSLDINSIDSSLKEKSFKYALLRYNSSSSSYDYDNPISEGDFSDFNLGKNNIITSIASSPKSQDLYRFVVYIDGNMYNDNSMMTSTLNSSLELIASKSVIKNVSNFIGDLYSDGNSVSTVNIGGDSSNPTISLNSTQNILLDNNGEYRYYGSSPNNYVSFNDELWRIISVSDVEGENGKIEKRVKIVRDTSIGMYSFDTKTSGLGSSGTSNSGSNNWSDARLMMLLNPGYESGAKDANGNTIYSYEGSLYWNRKSGTYYGGGEISYAELSVDFTNIGLTNEAKKMISKAVYNLGGVSHDSSSEYYYVNLYADDLYNIERSENVFSSHNSSWLGYVGLIYPSDYGYATDLTKCTKTVKYYNQDTNCTNNNWLFSGNHTWTMMPSSAVISKEIIVKESGALDINLSAYNTYNVLPVVFLNSDIVIVDGTGSKDDPYKLF